jgi:hypothetical protein
MAAPARTRRGRPLAEVEAIATNPSVQAERGTYLRHNANGRRDSYRVTWRATGPSSAL